MDSVTFLDRLGFDMAVLNGTGNLEKALNDIASKINNREVAIGFFEGATYPDGTPVPAVAFWNEFGTSKAPARPFFRTMISQESSTWGPKIAKLMIAFDYDAKRVLQAMGEDVSGALKQSINDLESPQLAQSTINAKGFAKPLIDTGHMRDSIGYEVSE